MYLLNDENKVTLYDIEFNNRSKVLNIAKELCRDSVDVKEYTKSLSDFAEMTEKGDKQPIYNPVYIGKETGDSKTIKITEYTSKTPYTLALVAYYSKNNWVQSLYQSVSLMNCKNEEIYLKKLVDRIMSSYGLFPQLYMTKCNFDAETYCKHNRLFEKLKDDQYSLEFFIEQYYPDIKAFMDLFPYIEFIETEVYKDGYFQENSFEVNSAEWNTGTMKQLGLTPNIRK